MPPNEDFEAKRVATLSAFQRMREANLARNQELLKKQNLQGLATDLTRMMKIVKKPQQVTPKTFHKRTFRPPTTPSTIRKSVRIQGGPAPEYQSLDDDDYLPDSPTENLLRKRAPKPSTGRGVSRGAFNSGKGVRYQGGRLYDSANGETCHWCRQKTVEDKVRCTAPNCGGGRRQVTVFCAMCLRNRHGEDLYSAKASGCWICPCCRGTCGEGCDSCCNCSFCRQAVGLAPTGNIKRKVLADGFDNAHDWLVHLKTKESQEEIKARKLKFWWGRFLEGWRPQNDAGAPGERTAENILTEQPISSTEQQPDGGQAPQVVARVVTREGTPVQTRGKMRVDELSASEGLLREDSGASQAVVMVEVVGVPDELGEESVGQKGQQSADEDVSENFMDAAMVLCTGD